MKMILTKRNWFEKSYKNRNDYTFFDTSGKKVLILFIQEISLYPFHFCLLKMFSGNSNIGILMQKKNISLKPAILIFKAKHTIIIWFVWCSINSVFYMHHKILGINKKGQIQFFFTRFCILRLFSIFFVFFVFELYVEFGL